MLIDISDVKVGVALEMNNEIWMVADAQHVKPGKGAAFVRAKLKNIKTDAVLDKTFRNSDKIEQAFLEERKFIYQYNSGDTFHFMDKETYEDLTISREQMGHAIDYLQDNMEVSAILFGHKLQKIVIANFIVAQIAETEPGVKGDSSKSSTKPAKLDTGASVLVPLFINQGDWVKIDTRDGVYVERVQK